MFPCIRCNASRRPSALYNVISPICMDSVRVQLCPSCFQAGIDAGEIVWLGQDPYGICAECEAA